MLNHKHDCSCVGVLLRNSLLEDRLQEMIFHTCHLISWSCSTCCDIWL